MGLITKEVEVGLGGSNKKWFENKHYNIPKNNKMKIPKDVKILVKVEDLQDNSEVKIDIECDNCGKEIKNITWQSYKKCVKEDGKYYCKKCANKLFASENARKTRLKNGKSFEQWCIENNRQDILDRWDYDLNYCKPNEISYTSLGINKNGFYFKCPNKIHSSEIFNICSLIRSKQNEVKCKKCNSFGFIYPYLIEYLKYKNDKEISYGSGKIITTICPNCKYEKNLPIRNLWSKGFSCPKCGDKIPYPEKYMYNLLEQLNIDFISQLTKSKYKWCEDYKYDFYIPLITSIIETHGMQHYKESTGNWKNEGIDKLQENDKLKKQLAIKNGIKEDNYIVIDCRYSNLEFIKNNILNSKLNELFDLSNIDWNKCHEFACSSRIKESCVLWNKGIRSTREIGKIMKLYYTTIIKYLKYGAELGWCDYNPEEQKKLHLENKQIPIICINTKEIYNSIADACRKYNLHDSNIIICCKDKRKSAGKHPETGEPLKWMYYNKYIEEKK